ncbi:riboflavin kinase [Massilia niabensis]|uniref:riboflavin kinase n=1 Tax=Massilia niabensis TaxID=544910 RepID=A0ABW0KZP9_9BURK
MKVLFGVRAGAALPPCVLAVADFDGMHGEHRRILADAGAQARARGIALAALVLAPARQTSRAHGSLRDTLAGLRVAGVDHVLISRSTHDAATALVALPNVRQVVTATEGQAWLDASAQLTGAVARADFPALRALRGHPFSVSGHVVHGRKLGRMMGFPTLNLKMKHGPAGLSGIYVVQVHGLAPHPLPAVASVGVRPTVERDGEPLLEVHVMETVASCYGKIVSVEFLKKLRAELRFDGIDALKAAIEVDVTAARRYFMASAA